jgi:tetratricopeptide (TPR) repeat protein
VNKAGQKKRHGSKKGHDLSDKRPLTNIKKNSLWQGVLTSLIAVIVFIGLLEGALALFGVNPQLQKEDPFVGFAASVPLFIRTTGEDGREVMATAPNRLGLFNRQEFSVTKEPGTYRIFSLGGSTTYGRPYNDRTSFPGWLSELLPVADPERKWEVINAGGISYASYRVAHLMKELVSYEPDLFIIYTGHNEFLEERTYGSLRDTPAVVRNAAEVLSRTRTWSAMSTVLNKLGASPLSRTDERDELAGEVDTILNRSTGPEQYERDDVLRDRIIIHYHASVTRMVDMARSAGADIIFVKPASNLKDSSPFKSQHTDGLGEEERLRSEELLSTARGHIGHSEWSEALRVLGEAIALDPRFSEHHYRRGRVLFSLGKYNEAVKALRRARYEDVCPLRALSPMLEILENVAEDKNVMLVDFINTIEENTMSEYGHSIPGKEYFLDHVHPTIRGHRILAVELIQTMAEMGLVALAPAWGKEAIAEVAARVEGGLDKEEHARALVNLVQVLNWAGKYEDAFRIARDVLTSGVKDKDVVKDAAAFSAVLSEKMGDLGEAMKYYRQAMKAAPGSPRVHYQVGLMFLSDSFRDYEAAGAHMLLASALSPENDTAHMKFGLAMAERQRYALAYPSIMEAYRLNPRNTRAVPALDRLRGLVSPDSLYPAPARVTLEKYESGSPRKIVQVRPDSTGREVPDGILTEWYEDGTLRSFIDYEQGLRHGVEIHWDNDGVVTSLARWKKGVSAGDAGKEAEVHDSARALSHYDIGMAFTDEGRLDEALVEFRIAVRLDPDNARYHNVLGITYGRKGLSEKAIESFRKAVQLDPSEPAYQRNIERAYGLGKKSGARGTED